MKNSFLDQKIRDHFQNQLEASTEKFQSNLTTLLVSAINFPQNYDWTPKKTDQGFRVFICPVTPDNSKNYPLYEDCPNSAQVHVTMNQAYKALNRPSDQSSHNAVNKGLINHYNEIIKHIHQTVDVVTVYTENGTQDMPFNEAIINLNVGLSILEGEETGQPYLAVTTSFY
ncbi:MAG: hypothetical protein VX154_09350 [Pseudomonadota bacterium]|nr:hypothetical protein [Pseudomonadota bacterium]